MKKALIVGINNYPRAPLNGCINDAAEVSSYLKTHGDGSPNFAVKLETDVPTKAKLKALIEELFKGDSEAALLYFSGHGYTDATGGYLVTPDFERYDEGVSMDAILVLANKSVIRNKVIILDCCHSGAFGTPATLGQVITQIGSGVTILTACRDNEPSMERDGHGIFTRLLLHALSGGAADLTGHITPGSVYAHIDQALGEWGQRPVFKTNVSQFISLRKINPPIPLDVLRRLTEYFTAPQDKFALDPSFEKTNVKDATPHITKPYATPENVRRFGELQQLEGVGLVVPNDTRHMFFAAMESKSCSLTALGHHYWNLVKAEKI
ncbi:caspase family protein [Hufsiella ginkgonis]|uniref:Caspase family protein n=1 Tax=Hufsiella ginkgonis TaxID=2695274 RepID=A0A7K1XVH4_9SPHI|nr:caspase family protein [Hufsiella ginkgonis]MXV14808.1 caspase family protein [Hufsiella ginkgonis]